MPCGSLSNPPGPSATAYDNWCWDWMVRLGHSAERFDVAHWGAIVSYLLCVGVVVAASMICCCAGCCRRRPGRKETATGKADSEAAGGKEGEAEDVEVGGEEEEEKTGGQSASSVSASASHPKSAVRDQPAPSASDS
uniref:Uncharacterized protein n=1 Tax=Chromera velia CCMP2878 TaxID=1169474 RepID=A0A0G4IAX5_9ALVE|eukprot:Cvel_2123.t1-p1 / transcript=Cvel_2123.t1 / gene=Cvel_2123 / organism=Chromera_velia_CCMP2878 / gene_product=hypothetical protein / transcript_product=hypothetical protein / location=Cvel_scaffold82:44860-45267(-) / protein_length=136 / sequence_SO=supercontig / SO=protein_coding / is_pseudo=false